MSAIKSSHYQLATLSKSQQKKIFRKLLNLN